VISAAGTFTASARRSSARIVTSLTVKFVALIETCKLHDIDPLAYLTDALTRIVNGHPPDLFA
jgi:transposase IS66-like protein